MRQKFRVIVIDDVDFCRELLTEFLEKQGYQVVSLANVTACTLFSAHYSQCLKNKACADFLLTDNRMPHMLGLDYLELVKYGNCYINPSCKAIFSANWTEDELRKIEQLGYKYFHKPYNLKALSDWMIQQEKLISPNRELVDLDSLLNKNKT